MNQPIFCVSVGRSGTSMILQLFNKCGAFIGTVGKNSKYCENLAIFYKIILPYEKNNIRKIHWRESVFTQLRSDGYTGGPWGIKGAHLITLWPIWAKAFPEAKWVIVRRRTGDVINSYMKTNYMSINHEACLELIHQYENSFIELINYGVDYKVVWPERMAYHDYDSIKEVVAWLGLQWSDIAFKFIDPKFDKTRIKENIRRMI